MPENFLPRISSIIKMAWFFVLYKVLQLDPRSIEIYCRIASCTDCCRFLGDIVEIDETYIYKADEGYDSTPPSLSMYNYSPISSSVLGYLI